jgi:hypothetical protein
MQTSRTCYFSVLSQLWTRYVAIRRGPKGEISPGADVLDHLGRNGCWFNCNCKSKHNLNMMKILHALLFKVNKLVQSVPICLKFIIQPQHNICTKSHVHIIANLLITSSIMIEFIMPYYDNICPSVNDRLSTCNAPDQDILKYYSVIHRPATISRVAFQQLCLLWLVTLTLLLTSSFWTADKIIDWHASWNWSNLRCRYQFLPHHRH